MDNLEALPRPKTVGARNQQTFPTQMDDQMGYSYGVYSILLLSAIISLWYESLKNPIK